MRRLLLVSMVAGVVLSALLLAVPARAAPGTSVVVSLDANRVALGAAFDARVVIQADVATTGAQCALSFNPAVLECTGVSAGDFYPSGSLMIPDPSAIDIDNVGGTVEMAATVAFAPVSAKSGSLFVYHFTAKAEGTSTLHLSDVIVMDDRFGELLGVTVNDGNLSVGPEPLPDLALTGLTMAWLSIGSSYTVGYTVANQGDAAVGAFKVGLYIDESAQPLVTEEIASLDAGEDYAGTFSGYAAEISGGTDVVKVCADVDGVVAESFENNNCKQGIFEQVTYTLRLNISQGCHVEVEADGGKLPTSYPATHQIYLGTELEVTAVVDEGYEFSDWVGDLSGQPNPVTITMDQDYTLGAVATETARPEEEGGGGGLSVPLIAGIIAGAVLVVAAAAYLAFGRTRGREG